MLEVDRLTARHGLLTAVRDVSITVNKGEVLGVIGANGAGKTTLFRAIAGVHPNMTGSIRLAGRDISSQSASRRVGAGLAMVPEGRRLFSDMTVRENLQIAAENGRKGSWTLKKVLAAFPAIEPILNALAGNLSGGQRQAVAIGRALMTNPEVVLLDEVSLGLSPIAIVGLYESLQRLKQEGETAMIVVEQDLSRAIHFADRLVCLLEGRIALEGAASTLTREAITDAYFGLGASSDINQEQAHA
jgi:branched-chain amino acid transport system ATP-binding protein